MSRRCRRAVSAEAGANGNAYVNDYVLDMIPSATEADWARQGELVAVAATGLIQKADDIAGLKVAGFMLIDEQKLQNKAQVVRGLFQVPNSTGANKIVQADVGNNVCYVKVENGDTVAVNATGSSNSIEIGDVVGIKGSWVIVSMK